MRYVMRILVGLSLLSIQNTIVVAQQPAISQPSPSQDQSQITPPAVGVPSDFGTAGAKAIPIGLRELSPWTMFLSASLVPQAIMIGLAFASLITWTIFVAKLLDLFISRRRLRAALKVLSAAQTLPEALSALASDRTVVRSFVATAINEARLSSDINNEAGIKERVASSFSEITRSESRRIRVGMGVLATIGATSPFIGLFGTVWGIMNSFIGISKLQTSNLAVVAPGIAEALLATGIGLFAAIPAVIIYNHFSRVTKGYLELVNRAAGAAGRQLSRDLDRANTGSLRRAAE
jgi:biopolymer transport protein ExbB